MKKAKPHVPPPKYTPEQRKEMDAQRKILQPNCSFCGKNDSQVFKLIVGPGVCICDECIDLCTDIINEAQRDKATVPCNKCKGAGVTAHKCPTCEGRGRFRYSCIPCSGTGRVDKLLKQNAAT